MEVGFSASSTAAKKRIGNLMEAFFPHIVIAPEPPPEEDIIGKFCVCVLCEYREGEVATEPQQTCEHKWLEFTRLRDGKMYVDIVRED